MPFSSGTFTFSANSFAPTPTSGTTISSSAATSTWSDLATALSTCLLKDGSQTTTSSVPFAVGIAVTTGMTTPSTTFALVNTTATTINFAGAASTLNIGVAAGTITLASATLATPTAFTMGLAAGTVTMSGSWCAQNSQSAAYPIVAADANKHILHPTADNNPRTFTIPANGSIAFPIGTMITFVNQINTVTIAITTDTLTLAGSGSTGSRTLAANGVATVIKVASTAWYITGTGVS